VSALKPADGGRGPSQLVKQVAILGLVFCTVAVLLAVPLRNYLAERATLGAELNDQQQLQAQLANLDEEKAALADPAYIAAEAKRRLQYVKPGDTVYVVYAPALPVVAASAAAAPKPAVAWYSHLWDTLSDPAVVVPPVVVPATVQPTSPSVTAPKAGR